MNGGMKGVQEQDQRDGAAISFCAGLLLACATPSWSRARRLNLTSIFCLAICPPLLPPNQPSPSISSAWIFCLLVALSFPGPRPTDRSVSPRRSRPPASSSSPGCLIKIRLVSERPPGIRWPCRCLIKQSSRTVWERFRWQRVFGLALSSFPACV